MADVSENTFDKTLGVEIQGWILNLTEEQFDAVLNELELTSEGTPFTRVDRLYRRLRGDYTSADFVESDSAESEITSRARREEKLCTMLKTTEFSEETLAQIAIRQVENLHQEDGSGFAPLANSSANNSEVPHDTTVTHINGQQMEQPITVAIMTTTTCTYTTSIAATASVQTANMRPKTVFSTVENRPRKEETVFCKMADGSTFYLPKQIALELIKAQSLAFEKDREMTALSQQMAEVASSTRINIPTTNTATRNGRKSNKGVNFQDTFELNYIEPNEEPRQRRLQKGGNDKTDEQRTSRLNIDAQDFQMPTETQRHTQNRAALPAPAEWQESGRGGYPPGLASNQMTQFLPDMSRTLLTSSDVGRTVRQWKVRFTGEKGESIEEFIQRVEECRRLAHISDVDLLNALSELLSGVALHWYRQCRTDWNTWANFCSAARRCYGVERNFQQRLIAEAQARKQGRKEPVRDYIFCLLTIFSRMEAPPSMQYQLDMLYANMRPSLRKLVPKEKVTNVDRLVQLARDAEELLEEEQNFPAPLTPEQSVLPSVAYREPEEKKQKGGKSSSERASMAVASIADPSMDRLKSMLEKLLDERLKPRNRPVGNNRPQQQQANGSRWTRKPEMPRNRTNTANKSGLTIVEVTDDDDQKTQDAKPRPARNRNQGNKPGPRARVYCFLCGWPGYVRSTCPACSGNEKRGE